MVDQTSKSEPLSNNDAQHQPTSDTDSVKATPDQKTDAAKSSKGRDKDKEPQFDPNRPRRFKYGEYLGGVAIGTFIYQIKWLQDHLDSIGALSFNIALGLTFADILLIFGVGFYLSKLAKQDNAWINFEKYTQEEEKRVQKEQANRNTEIQLAKVLTDTEESKLRIKRLEAEIEQIKLQNALLKAKLKQTKHDDQ